MGDIPEEFCNAHKGSRKIPGRSSYAASMESGFGILYLCYDLEKEFLPQFQKNAEKLLRGLQMTADTKTT